MSSPPNSPPKSPGTMRTESPKQQKKSSLHKAKMFEWKSKKHVHVKFSDEITVLESNNEIDKFILPFESDDFSNFDIISTTRNNHHSISTRKLKKLSKKSLSYLQPLINDKKTRRKQELQRLINSMHKRDAAEERRQRLEKINKKFGYTDAAPIIVRAKPSACVAKNKSEFPLHTERKVVPCLFSSCPLSLSHIINHLRNNGVNISKNCGDCLRSSTDSENSDISDNSSENVNSDGDNNNNNIDQLRNSSSSNENTHPLADQMNDLQPADQIIADENGEENGEISVKKEDEVEMEIEGEEEQLWMEQIGKNIFGLFTEIGNQMIISDAKYFLQTFELLPSTSDCEIIFKFIPLNINQIISSFTHGIRDFSVPKNNKSIEVRKGILRFDVPSVKDHWLKILFPSDQVNPKSNVINHRGRSHSLRAFNNNHQHLGALSENHKNSSDDMNITYHSKSDEIDDLKFDHYVNLRQSDSGVPYAEHSPRSLNDLSNTSVRVDENTINNLENNTSLINDLGPNNNCSDKSDDIKSIELKAERSNSLVQKSIKSVEKLKMKTKNGCKN